jgi:DNA-binding beta-propeller fold protein YncE
LYTAAPSVGVFVLNVARCNAQTTSGCRQHVKQVNDQRGPDSVGIDLATDTVYVADGGTNSPGDTVSVINGATCNGTTGGGCGRAPHTITVGSGPFWLTVDQSTNTVYVANNFDNTVSVINGATCNGPVTKGCQSHPPAVVTGGGVSFLGVDESRHTLFVLNQFDDTMSAIDTRTCNGHDQSGCPHRARNAWLPWNAPVGENPGAFAIVPGTGTAYLMTPGSGAFLAADSITRCSALTTVGCRREAAGVAVNGAFPEVDPATDTIYAGNSRKPGIQVLNGATCNASDHSGCKAVATIPFPHPQANLGAIDHATHTLYASDTFSDTVYAIDIQHCNAHDTSGCSAPKSKMTIGPYPSLPVLDPATHTLYVPEATSTSSGPQFNRIAVLNAATCNAVISSRCGQAPGTIDVGMNTFTIAVSAKTDSIYAAVLGSSFLNNTVWVISGAHCKGTDHSGCGGAVVARAKVGDGPSSVIVNDATHTVYADNNADGDVPGTVSVINGATCNGSVTTSCPSSKPTVPVGRSPVGMAFDPQNHRVYVADYSHAAVSIIDAARCNATHTSGCATPAPEQPVGSQPGFVWVNAKEGTVYVTAHLRGVSTLWSFFPSSP